jgi:hypothetical protein
VNARKLRQDPPESHLGTAPTSAQRVTERRLLRDCPLPEFARRAIPWLLLALVLSVPCTASGAGFAQNESLIVFAPDQALAETVLAKANLLREQIAEEWFGEELPSASGRALVHVELADAEQSGLTWVKDPADPKQKLHRVWVTAPRERALGSMLAHEMTHVVFATRFPDRLPVWIEEGIASLHDDPGRAARRRRALERYAETGNWPSLSSVLEASRAAATDDSLYSTAPSMVEYLLTRNDKPTLVRLAAAAKQKGWDAAFQEYYGFRNVADFQTAWQTWASRADKSYASGARDGGEPLAALRRRR